MAETNDPTRRGFIRSASATLLAAATAAQMAQAAGITLAPPDKQPPKLPLPEASGRKLRFAIVGLGELAVEEILPAFALCSDSQPTALVSGHPEKAKKLAEHYGINPKNIYNYDNFDEIKGNAEIDVVYIVLPNHMHAEFTIRALKAGKHVLCEKPMATSVEECEKMIAAAKQADRKLMIAYRLQYEPFNLKMIDYARSKTFGDIHLIEAENVQITNAPNIRLSNATGGGPLGDVGIYCINATRYITGEEPAEVFGMVHQPKDDPRFAEVPASFAWTMRFPSGVLANCSCGFDASESRRYRVMCKDGWFELDKAFSYGGLRLHTSAKDQRAEVSISPRDHFASEMDDFSQRLRENKPPKTPGEEGLADMKVIAAIKRSTESGKAERV